MLISDSQKNIIQSLLQGQVFSINDFIKKKLVAYSTQIIPDRDFYYARDAYLYDGINRDYYYLPHDRLGLKSDLIDFVQVVSILVQNGLLLQIERESSKLIYPLIKQDNFRPNDFVTDYELLSIVFSVREYEFHPTAALHPFVEANYLTESEILENKREQYLQDEMRDRKVSMRLTFALAIISILVSIATTYINVSTYTTLREVRITNLKTINDTTKVLLVNPLLVSTKK